MTLSSLRIVAVALALPTAAPVLAQEAIEAEAVVQTGDDGFHWGWLGLLGLLGLAGLRGRRNDHTTTTTMR